jgi:hypothetical protein
LGDITGSLTRKKGPIMSWHLWENYFNCGNKNNKQNFKLKLCKLISCKFIELQREDIIHIVYKRMDLTLPQVSLRRKFSRETHLQRAKAYWSEVATILNIDWLS